jgi:hypothetical protein
MSRSLDGADAGARPLQQMRVDCSPAVVEPARVQHGQAASEKVARTGRPGIRSGTAADQPARRCVHAFYAKAAEELQTNASKQANASKSDGSPAGCCETST